jgi:hypothetical protein
MRLIAPALFVVLTAAAQTPKDVAGWGTVKWGMTVAEAKAALGNGAIPETGVGDPRDFYTVKLRLEKVQIGRVNAIVNIVTKKDSDFVCAVTLLPTIESTSVPTAHIQAPALFEDLKQMLIEKYGQPKTSGAVTDPGILSQGVRTTAFWSFPSTTITLIGEHSEKYHTGFVSVTYEPVDRKALDKL